MGSWGYDIMQGDTPLDWEDFLYETLEIEKFNDNGINEILPENFTNEKLASYLIAADKDKSDTAYLVLGVIMMKSGASINDELKNKILKAAERDNSWAGNKSERKPFLDKFKENLISYSGTPIVIKSKGLIETMLDNKTDDLINVPKIEIKKATNRLINTVWTLEYVLISPTEIQIISYTKDDNEGYLKEKELPQVKIEETEDIIEYKIIMRNYNEFNSLDSSTYPLVYNVINKQFIFSYTKK